MSEGSSGVAKCAPGDPTITSRAGTGYVPAAGTSRAAPASPRPADASATPTQPVSARMSSIRSAPCGSREGTGPRRLLPGIRAGRSGEALAVHASSRTYAYSSGSHSGSSRTPGPAPRSSSSSRRAARRSRVARSAYPALYVQPLLTSSPCCTSGDASQNSTRSTVFKAPEGETEVRCDRREDRPEPLLDGVEHRTRHDGVQHSRQRRVDHPRRREAEQALGRDLHDQPAPG